MKIPTLCHEIEWRHARAWMGRRLVLTERWLDVEAGTTCRVMCIVDFGPAMPADPASYSHSRGMEAYGSFRAPNNAVERTCNSTYNWTINRTFMSANMANLTANDLKTRGVSALETALRDGEEAIISVRGRPRYVVMDIPHYEKLREAEIFAAWQESRAAEARGDYVSETAEEHIARLVRDTD